MGEAQSRDESRAERKALLYDKNGNELEIAEETTLAVFGTQAGPMSDIAVSYMHGTEGVTCWVL